jgi:HEAT repeat protein
MPTTTDDPLPDLMRSLRSRTASDRVKAAKDLGRLGWLARESLPTLVGLLRDDDAKVREAAAHAVGQMGPEALPALSGMLAHNDKYVRRNAVWAMGKLGPQAKGALTALCRGLSDADPRTASGAAQALGNMGSDAAEAVPALTEAMRGTNIVLCRLAAKALSQVGEPALDALIAHLQHTDPFVRGEAALAIGWMGPDGRAAVPYLARIVRGKQGCSLRDTPPPAGKLDRKSIVAADSNHDDDEEESGAITPVSVPPVDGSSPEETCRVYAAQALGRMGALAASAADDLRLASRTGSEPVRTAAIQALKHIHGE